MRKLIALAAATLLAVAAIGATIGTAGAAPVTGLYLYEDANRGGDAIYFAAPAQDPDLSNNTHTQAGLCSPKLYGTDNWNDCVSSVRFAAAYPTCVRFFKNSNYGTHIVQMVGQGENYWQTYNFTGSNNDTLSSFWWGTWNSGTSTCND